MLYAYKFNKETLIKIIKTLLPHVILHEIGHCLGLRHYMNRSFYATMNKLVDSIMDYFYNYSVEQIDPDNYEVVIDIRDDFGDADEFVLKYLYTIIPSSKKCEINAILDAIANDNPILLTDEVVRYELTTEVYDIGNNPEIFLSDLYKILNSIKINLADLFDKRIFDAKTYTKLLINNTSGILNIYIDYIIGYLRNTTIDQENRIFSFDVEKIPVTIAMILILAYYKNFFVLNSQEKKSMMANENRYDLINFYNENVTSNIYYFDRFREDINVFIFNSYLHLYYDMFNAITSLYMTYLANSGEMYDNMRPEEFVYNMFDSILFGYNVDNDLNQLQPFYDIFLMSNYLQTSDPQVLVQLKNYYDDVLNSGEWIKFVLWRNSVLYSISGCIAFRSSVLYPYITSYTLDVFGKISLIIENIFQNQTALATVSENQVVFLELKRLYIFTATIYAAKPNVVSYPINVVGADNDITLFDIPTASGNSNGNGIKSLKIDAKMIFNKVKNDNKFTKKLDENIQKLKTSVLL